MKKTLRLVLAGTFVLAFATPAAAAFNGFANFGDIKGESTDKDHKDWVMILKFDHAVTQPPAVSTKRSAPLPTGGTIQLKLKSADIARRLTKGQASSRRRGEVVIDLNCQPNGPCERHVFTDVMFSGVGPDAVNLHFGSHVTRQWKPAEPGKLTR